MAYHEWRILRIIAAASSESVVGEAHTVVIDDATEETSLPAPSSLALLADEFLATLHDHGIHVERDIVEQEMRDRIADIAERLRVSPEAVLRDHAREGWGRQMAVPVIAEIRHRGLLDAGETQRLAT